MNYIEIKSCAKINIGLKIVSKRHDGFHNLITLFYPIRDLADTLIIKKSDTTKFTSNIDSIKNWNSNLILDAKKLLERKLGKRMDVDIHLEKVIPIGAGLGGGSSNAAVTLLSLNDMFNLNIDHDTMIRYALELGSDVPFFIKPQPAIAMSRGEILEYINLEIDKTILIVNPGIHISTKEAFANISPEQSNIDFRSLIENGKLNYQLAEKILVNDFESYVFTEYPEVMSIKKEMYTNGAVFSLMSGSGSTVYGFFDSKEDAQRISDNLPADYFRFMSRI
ncbi:MAG: 4-(cytidine 5'-diphospho)-2-C-methyl-D-erythritol kinase [Melioribacteraceae bacterium]|nr:4-(cytidine 5'-diphospho)-2-C-methyl-D-erythritol kinase [Melioribacteraceae bacterium]MCF8352869.1 4-(cytidine 5'-diphospho)-2-C-methyl-D-erythritol kinase [Melioribacteraceae bacterium]MCF8393814.1 4-(cytidine 5'-diphospho)-2-C-methyl-D-erythritol kinase [Melioribacteraceae bacterium]MCF8417386.1 4-(cytidine 5'-diphospho)-2-C-methyl-D-erythritol kinase [Melioribacteraceae bacterium]